MNIVTKKPNELKAAVYNPRADLRPGDPEFEKIRNSIRAFGYVDPIIYNKRTGNIVGGHQRFKVMVDEGYEEIEVVEVDLSDSEEKALNLALNKISGQWDMPKLKDLIEDLDTGDIDMLLTGFDIEEIESLMTQFNPDEPGDDSEDFAEEDKANMRDKFLVPPFSILDARQGYWNDRKRKWAALGIKGELGRGEDLLYANEQIQQFDYYKAKEKEKEKARNGKGFAETFDGQARLNAMMGGEVNKSGVSIFDPVLCELAYHWFSPIGGTVLDPFAGGSVRGIVAAKTGRQYYGMDLRGEQVEANQIQGEEICLPNDPKPVWKQGDSLTIAEGFKDVEADFLFSCPPYADLEVYSDDPKDISTMDYPDFVDVYSKIIKEAASLLKPDRFAMFVVGEVRDKKGFYRNFVVDTINAFHAAGLHYYNEMILVTSIGTLPVRAGRQFNASRKIGKTHQNVLVFYKGDPKKIKENFPEINLTEILKAMEENSEGVEDEYGEQL